MHSGTARQTRNYEPSTLIKRWRDQCRPTPSAATRVCRTDAIRSKNRSGSQRDSDVNRRTTQPPHVSDRTGCRPSVMAVAGFARGFRDMRPRHVSVFCRPKRHARFAWPSTPCGCGARDRFVGRAAALESRGPHVPLPAGRWAKMACAARVRPSRAERRGIISISASS